MGQQQLTRRRGVTWLAVALLLVAAEARAQVVFEMVGERALGMGGAFVAVANDATAAHWNPAGLVHGQPAGVTIGWQRFQTGKRNLPPYGGPALETASFTSLGTWPLGVSHGRFQTTSLVTRPDGSVGAVSLRTNQYAVSILQSIVEGLVVGSTLKYVRGTVASGPIDGPTVAEALREGSELDADTNGAFDLDLGVMADFQKVRVGLTLKNLTAPEFGAVAESAIALQRQVRLGVALLPTDGLTLAIDLDLDTVDLRDGLRRMIAIGGEGRLGRRLSLRSGLRWSLEGSRQLVGAVGGSVSLRSGFWLDGHYSQGRQVDDRGFGVALRAGF
jgi:hypothetical protein